MKDKQREYETNKKYRLAHPELYREAVKRYYRANREKVLGKAKTYRAEHSDSASEYNKKYRLTHLTELRQRDKLRYQENREAELARNRKYRQDNYERLEAVRIERTYGVTPEQYQELSERQRGLCAICGKKPKRLMVDHCHKTTQVRGLLCRHCNGVIGLASDNLEILKKAHDYLST